MRDKKTGLSKGFAFIAYEGTIPITPCPRHGSPPLIHCDFYFLFSVRLADARSCVLAVDNFNGAKILNRVARVDHVKNYRRPKKDEKSKDKRDDEKEGIDLPSDDEDYDERRKSIWDYELYNGTSCVL